MSKIEIAQQVLDELERANSKYNPQFTSLNEALGTIYGEFCEMRNDIISHQAPEKIREECIQVAAMCIKAAQYLDKKVSQ